MKTNKFKKKCVQTISIMKNLDETMKMKKFLPLFQVITRGQKYQSRTTMIRKCLFLCQFWKHKYTLRALQV